MISFKNCILFFVCPKIKNTKKKRFWLVKGTGKKIQLNKTRLANVITIGFFLLEIFLKQAYGIRSS